MNRDLIINILLILAGIVLAFALFGAGVLWKSKSTTRTPSLSQFVLPKPRLTVLSPHPESCFEIQGGDLHRL